MTQVAIDIDGECDNVVALANDEDDEEGLPHIMAPPRPLSTTLDLVSSNRENQCR